MLNHTEEEELGSRRGRLFGGGAGKTSSVDSGSGLGQVWEGQEVWGGRAWTGRSRVLPGYPTPQAPRPALPTNTPPMGTQGEAGCRASWKSTWESAKKRLP